MSRTVRIGTLLALVFVLAMSALIGCGTQQAAAPKPEEKKPTVLRMNNEEEPTTLDPALITSGTEIRIAKQTWTGLLDQDPDGKLIPKLAEKWDISADGKTYTFTLRKGVKFQNGREVTADDFVWSMTRALDPKMRSSTALLYLGDIVGAQAFNEGKAQTVTGLVAKDKSTLQITIDAAKAYFLAKLTYPTAYPIAKEEVAKGANWTEGHKAGTGPFILDKWTHKDKVMMSAWADYYEGKAKVNQLQWSIIGDQNTALLMYKNGELDIVEVPPLQYDSIKKDATLGKEERERARASVTYLALNQGAYAPFKDKRVRQAFAMAMDKKGLAQVVYQNTVDVAGGFLPPGIPGYDKTFTGLAFDPAKAKQLLAEAGFKDPAKMPKLVITYNSRSPNYDRMAQYYQAQWKQNLGVPVEIQGKEGGAYTSDVFAGNVVHVFIGSWGADYIDAQNFLSGLFASTSSRAKRVGYLSKPFDNATLTADVEKDQAKRTELYKQGDKILVADDAAVVPIYYPKYMWLQKPYVKGYERDSMEVIQLTRVTVEK